MLQDIFKIWCFTCNICVFLFQRWGWGGTSGFLSAPIIFWQTFISYSSLEIWCFLKPEVLKICLSYWSSNFFNWSVLDYHRKYVARLCKGSLVYPLVFLMRISNITLNSTCWAGELLVFRFLCWNAEHGSTNPWLWFT